MILIKEIITILAMIAVGTISRAEYVEFIANLQTGNATDVVFLIPTALTLIMSSMFMYVTVYTLSRWWVWRAYHKVKWSFLFTHSLLVIPFYAFITVLFVGATIVYRVFTSTFSDLLSSILFIVSSLLAYLVLMVWVTYGNAYSMLGKNPWYNQYDAFKRAWSRQGANVVGLYTIPIIVSGLSTFANVSPAFIPISIWLTYLFARQFVVSKTAHIIAYCQHIVRSYRKTLKTLYKKVF